MGFSSVMARLLVRDFGACCRFYHDTLGLVPHWGDGSGGYASFSVGGKLLALFEQPLMAEGVGTSDKPPVADTQDGVVVCFEVDDVDDEWRRLAAQGVLFVNEPVNRPDWHARVAHFRDPDGNLVEIGSALKETQP